jgi:hypothetical protein
VKLTPLAVGCGEGLGGEQPVGPFPQRLDLLAGQVLLQPVGQGPVEVGPQPAQHVHRLGGQWFPEEAPQHGAQLLLVVQADAMVDAVDAAVGSGQDMATLAVGVVEQDVEHRQPPQLRRVRVHQQRRVAEPVVGAQHPTPPAGDVLHAHHVHQRSLVLDLYPQLHHSGAERSGPQHRRRYLGPSGGLRDQVGRHLPVGERAVREVPQRPLAADGLVHAARLDAATADRAEQGGVGGVDDAAGDLDPPGAQQRQRHRVGGEHRAAAQLVPVRR